jgi:hypothetical protein
MARQVNDKNKKRREAQAWIDFTARLVRMLRRVSRLLPVKSIGKTPIEEIEPSYRIRYHLPAIGKWVTRY